MTRSVGDFLHSLSSVETFSSNQKSSEEVFFDLETNFANHHFENVYLCSPHTSQHTFFLKFTKDRIPARLQKGESNSRMLSRIGVLPRDINSLPLCSVPFYDLLTECRETRLRVGALDHLIRFWKNVGESVGRSVSRPDFLIAFPFLWAPEEEPRRSPHLISNSLAPTFSSLLFSSISRPFSVRSEFIRETSRKWPEENIRNAWKCLSKRHKKALSRPFLRFCCPLPSEFHKLFMQRVPCLVITLSLFIRFSKLVGNSGRGLSSFSPLLTPSSS